MPHNGAFGWAFERPLAGILDGQSNTLLIGEWIHIDQRGGDMAKVPGNVRGWIMGSNENKASYSYKIVQHTINAPLDRGADGIAYNHLPFGSYHTGGANFALLDGSVHFLTDQIDFELYKDLATCNGSEDAQLP